MIINFLNMNGYGFFVWLSFGITALACGIVYFKTRKTLKKYEKDYAEEFKKLTEKERKTVLEKSKIANQVLISQNKTL